MVIAAALVVRWRRPSSLRLTSSSEILRSPHFSTSSGAVIHSSHYNQTTMEQAPPPPRKWRLRKLDQPTAGSSESKSPPRTEKDLPRVIATEPLVETTTDVVPLWKQHLVWILLALMGSVLYPTYQARESIARLPLLLTLAWLGLSFGLGYVLSRPEPALLQPEVLVSPRRFSSERRSSFLDRFRRPKAYSSLTTEHRKPVWQRRIKAPRSSGAS